MMKIENMFEFRQWRKIHINGLVRRFIIADLFLLAGWGLISPMYAIFVLNRVASATVVTVGIAAAIYWGVKSLIQLPIAVHLDRTRTETDDFHTLVISLVLAGLTGLAFLLVRETWHLYLVEVLHAASFGLYIPSYNGIFSRHVDSSHRAFEFSLDSTAVGIASGITGLLGSIIVNFFGFPALFSCTAVLSFVAAGVMFYSPQVAFPPPVGKTDMPLGDHTPRNITQ